MRMQLVRVIARSKQNWLGCPNAAFTRPCAEIAYAHLCVKGHRYQGARRVQLTCRKCRSCILMHGTVLAQWGTAVSIATDGLVKLIRGR